MENSLSTTTFDTKLLKNTIGESDKADVDIKTGGCCSSAEQLDKLKAEGASEKPEDCHLLLNVAKPVEKQENEEYNDSDDSYCDLIHVEKEENFGSYLIAEIKAAQKPGFIKTFFLIFRRIYNLFRNLMARRRNEILLFFALFFSFLSTFFQASGHIKGKLQLRKQPLPRRFFSPTSPVRDLYNGNGAAVHELLGYTEVAFVMYYAPWSTRCRDAKFHFDQLSRNFGDRGADAVTFLAVNCWDPGGKCKRMYKMYTYPVFLLYIRTVSLRGIYYNYIVSADYMYKFLTNALNPLLRLNEINEAYYYFSRTENLYVMGYFDLAQKIGQKQYELFYDAAVQALETDPLRDQVKFAVINNLAVARHFNLTTSGTLRIYHWSLSENLVYNINVSSFDVQDVLKWAFEFYPHKTQWYYSRTTKDERFYETLTSKPTIILFTPRQPLTSVNHQQTVFADVALKYWGCDRPRWIRYISKAMLAYSRQSFNEWNSLLKRTCRPKDPINLDSLITTCCSEVVVSDSYLNYRNVCSLCSAYSTSSTYYKPKSSYIRPKFSGDSNENTCNENAIRISNIITSRSESNIDKNLCEYIKKCMGMHNFVDHCCKYGKNRQQSLNFCPLFDIFSRNDVSNNVKSQNKNQFSQCSPSKLAYFDSSKDCAKVKLAEILKYSLHDSIFESNFKEENFMVDDFFKGLGCATNKTLNFLSIDSNHYRFLRENLGISNQNETAVVIVDANAETIYNMPQVSQLTSKSLSAFIVNYTFGHLSRHLKSEKSMRTSSAEPHLDKFVDSQDELKESRVRVDQITSSTFNRTVLNGQKDVILLYKTRWCGFCHQIFHVFQLTAYYFRSLSHKLLFATIDADRNDLPWQYTVDSYPTILFFPQNNRNESMMFPRKLPVTLPNLVSFVLSQCNWRARLEFSFSSCSRRCLQRNRRRIVKNLKKLQRSLIRLRRLAEDKAYLWIWVDDDPDYGPYIPAYMKQIWKKIAETNVKIRTLNLLLRFIMRNERNFNDKNLFLFSDQDANLNLMNVLSNVNAQR